MKVSFAAGLAALALVAVSAFAPAANAANLAVAPSFEEGIVGWTGWPSLPVQRSTEFAHTGKYSIPFPQGEPTGRWRVTGMDTIPYVVEPRGRYRCAIFARAGTTPAYVALSVSTSLYDYAKPSAHLDIPADGAWHEVAMEFTNPDFVKSLVVSLNTNGTVWVDDFSLAETAPPPVKPLDVTVNAPIYVGKNAPLSFDATVRNNTDAAQMVTLSANAWLPDGPSPMALPLKGYGKALKSWEPVTVNVAAHASADHRFVVETTGLPESGIKIDVAAASGENKAAVTDEAFICDRPDWRTWYSVGAQCYTPNRYDGTWLKSLHDLGGDSVRETFPLPMSYRNAVPGQFTDFSPEARLSYYMRVGLKWLTAYHTIINNGPAWLAEDPANRRTRFDGTVLQRPSLSYFAPKARAALMQDAELGGREIAKCPAIFGVQIDNEINALDTYDPAAEQSFRDYVQKEFGTVAAVNAVWGTSYTSFGDIHIPAPLYTNYFDDPSGQLDAPQPETRIPSRDFTWLKWREDSFIQYYRDWTAHFKKTAPEVPVTDNFSLYVSTLPRFYYAAPVNLFRFAEFFDLGGVDTGPSCGLDPQYDAYQFDWVNSAWGDRPVWVPEIYYDWQKADPHAVGFDLFYGMGRKVQHTNLFTWPVLTDQWGGPYSDNLRRDRSEMLDNIQHDIAQAKKFNAEVPVGSLHYVKPSVGVYWSRDIHDFALAMRSPDWLPGADPLYDMDKIFTDLQYPVSFVDEQKLGSALDQRALFVSGAYALSPEKWNALLAYARQGGTLFLNGNIGSYDEHLKPFAASPCGRGSDIGIEACGWQGDSTELYNDAASPLVKLGKGRKVRGFGRYSVTKISADWQSLLKDSSGKPGLVTRAFGKGRIYWSLTDIANPYANYQTSNTLFLVEGILEAAGIGRPVRVMDASDGTPAPKITVAIKRRSATEAYIFANNFGPDGTFRFYVNAPLAHLAVTEMLTGTKEDWTSEHGCAAFNAPMPKCGYAVFRIVSDAVDLERLPVRAVQVAPPAMASDSHRAPLPVPTVASLTEAKTASGTPLYWLSSPFVRAAVAPERGGRISYLSTAGTDINDVMPMTGVFPADGIVSSDSGGIKPVLDLDGKTFPGLTMANTFTVTGATSSADQASVGLRTNAEGVQLDETISVSKTDPALRVAVRQQTDGASRKLRLYLHANLLLNGEVSRNIAFVAGDGKQSVAIPYRMGMQTACPVAFPATWGGVVDAEKQTAVLAVLDEVYSHVTFWNGMRDYNFEVGSDVQDISAASPQDGQISLYACSEMRGVNFVSNGLAGNFRSFPEAGGQSVAVSLCGLTGVPQLVDLVIVGTKAATKEERELGSFSLTVKPVIGIEKNLSLGGAGSGYDTYRLSLKRDGALIPLKEVAGDGGAADTSPAAPSAIAAWSGDENKTLTQPVRTVVATHWTLESGTVSVRFKTDTARDIVHRGVDLVNGYHGAPDYNTNRTSRLWLNIHGLAQWSPTAPMIFLMLYDKAGHRIQATANAPLRDDTWYELTAIWDTKARRIALYLDGLPLKLAETDFPADWQGADPLETLDLGGSGCVLGSGNVLESAVPPVKDE